MQSLAIPAHALPAKLPLFRAGPAVDLSPIWKGQHDVEAVVVLLVDNAGTGQPSVKALHGLCLHALLVTLRVWLTSFSAAVSAAARVANILTDELTATHAVAAIGDVIFEKAHTFTS
ncbi:hypothetical protein M3M50_10640 [Pseudomonas bijieensis]|uniref:hypothetical protein n=1 Tax=Pseudomonas bijieensis TaxID=2681983 RepID=UPI00200C7CE9|nr:hypothetical protein [Pseudomonas bijieensis]UQI33055.1 hypothetical protein M3M50_10640 [Pseudomonas bijieensis]